MGKLKWIQIVALISGIACSAAAQKQAGVFAGVNIATMHITPNEDNSLLTLPSLGIGGFIDYGITENISLSLGMMYLQKGVDVQGDESNFQIKLAYAQMPVLFKFAFSDETMGPYLVAGPAFGFIASAKTTFNIDGVPYEIDTKDGLKEFDFGLDFGGGVDVPVGSNTFFIEARYFHGMMNIENESVNNSSTRNSGFLIFAGATFSINNDF